MFSALTSILTTEQQKCKLVKVQHPVGVGLAAGCLRLICSDIAIRISCENAVARGHNRSHRDRADFFIKLAAVVFPADSQGLGTEAVCTL